MPRAAQLLEAYAVGFEVSCAVARGLPVEPHYSRGWHATVDRRDSGRGGRGRAPARDWTAP